MAEHKREPGYRLIVVLFFLLHLFCSGSASAANTQYKVAAFSLKPLVFADSRGNVHGISVDLLNQVAEEHNWEFKYVPGTWNEGIEGVRAEKLDLLTMAMFTPERDQFLDYCKVPYFTVWSSVYARPDTAIQTILDLKGATVAIMQGDQNGKNFKKLARQFDLQPRYLELPDFEAVFQAVNQGQAKAAVVVNIFGMMQAESFKLSQTPIIFDPNPLYFATASGTNRELLKTLDATLTRWKQDEHSFYYQTLNSWLAAEGAGGTFIPIWVYYLLGLSLVTLLVTYGWNRSLRVRVDQRTAELTRQSQQLRESEKKLRILFTQGSGAIFVIDRASGRYVDANHAAEMLTGRTLDEIKTLTSHDLTPVDAQNRLNDLKRAQGAIDFGEAIYVRPDGERRTALLSAIPINAELAYGLALDISERKQAELDMEASQELLKTILNSLPAGVYVAELETTKILFMNQQQMENYGGDFTGWPCREAFAGSSNSCSRCPKDVLLDDQQRPTGIHSWEEWNPELNKFYMNHDLAILWIDGRYVRLHISTEITQMKELEQQLRQKFKMESIGVMAGGIAHNFNNSLAIVLGSLEMALRKFDDADKVRSYIDQARTASLQSRDLVAQILAYSRQNVQEKQVICLHLIIKEALSLLRSTLPSTASLVYQPSQAASDLCIEAEAGRIQEVLFNLCNNAVHAFNETGTISIGLERVRLAQDNIPLAFDRAAGDYVCLSVSDDGMGMEEQLQERIFDPFFSTKKAHEGAGMGLATVQGIVQQHGGLIKLHSTPGQGSTFELYFPLCDKPTAENGSLATSDGEPFTGKETLLVVDDEPRVLDVAREMLEDLGYRVLTSLHPAEALSTLRESQTPIDLLITDQTMPDQTGIELAHEARQHDPDLPVILITGYSSKISQEDCTRYGIAAYCQKPLHLTELSRIVREVLDHPQSRS